ncbi:cytochrome P450 2 sub U member 1 [Bulinus truncatus]|nr:cytochrome P450 2 sub U member 1 [Bulinus truncatus]
MSAQFCEACTIIIIVFLLSLAILLGWSIITFYSRRRLPPGPFPLPLFGNLLLLARAGSNHLEVFKSLKDKYGKIFTLNLGVAKFIVINDLKLMQEAFVKNGHIFSDRPHDNLYILKITEDRVGRGLILSDTEVAKEIRKFSLSAMRDLGVGKRSLEEKITEEMNVVLEELDKLDGQPHQIKSLLAKATSNIISSIIFNSRFSYDDPKFTELLDHLDKATKVNPLFLPVNFFPFMRFLPSMKQKIENFVTTFKSTDDYIKTLTEKNEITYDSANIRDFVDLTIQMRQSNKGNHHFNESNMRYVIVDLFIGGSDTTAASLSWAILYMAAFPDVQLKCQQEIDKLIGKSRSVTLNDKVNLPYTEATVLEVLRLKPVAPLSPPHCPVKDAELHGYSIPKSSIIMANISLIHHDPVNWPEPDKFQPEHFLDKEGKVINRDKMVSFSVGPRSCLGENLAKMEMFIFFTRILQFFTVKPAPGKTIDLTPFAGFVFQPIPQDLVFVKR